MFYPEELNQILQHLYAVDYKLLDQSVGKLSDINRKTRDLLLANGFAVDVPAGQRCCGALL